MATQNKDLSDYNKSELPTLKDNTIGIVSSVWNKDITNGLTQGAAQTLADLGLPSNQLRQWEVPGSFELIYAANQICKQHTQLDALIVIGSLIKGETAHFDYVCQAVSQGIKEVNIIHDIPVVFCLLTDNSHEQAVARSGGNLGNKGVEAAVTAAKMIDFKHKLQQNH